MPDVEIDIDETWAEEGAAWIETAKYAVGAFAPVLAAMDAYNGIVRTAAQIAKRSGDATNWDGFYKHVSAALNEHHQTWVKFSPWLAGALSKSHTDPEAA